MHQKRKLKVVDEKMLRSVEQTIYVVHGLYPTRKKRNQNTFKNQKTLKNHSNNCNTKKPYNKLVYVQPVNPETGIQILY